MTKQLSDTARIVLAAAAQRANLLALPLPQNLKGGAAQKVVSSLLKQGLLEEIDADTRIGEPVWRKTGDGHGVTLAITEHGLAAIGIDPNEGAAPAVETIWHPEDFQPAPDSIECPAVADPWDAAPAEAPTARHSLRDAATALLAAWDACPAQDAADNAISRAVEQMRASLASKADRAPKGSRKQREGTKQERVLDMLRRPEGATVEQVSDATDWAHHTVRGFFAGLKKKGHAVEAREKVRMVGPNKTGAKGSYTIYALAK